MEAARELKGKLPELEREVGIHATIGPVEDATHAEVERLLDGGAPQTIHPRNVIVHDFRQPPIFREPRPLEEVPLGDRKAIDRILAEANDSSEPRKQGVFRWLGRNILKKLGFLAMMAGAPIPQMQLQHCEVAREGALIELRCDASDVCPRGWILETVMDDGWPDSGADLIRVLGYGPGVENNCVRPQGSGRRVKQLLP